MHHITKEDRNDFVELLNTIIKNWYWYAISVIALLTIAFLFNTYAEKRYRVTAKITIPQSRGYANAAELLPGFEQLMGNNNFLNEIELLRSFPIVNNTVKKLNFEVSYFKKEKLCKRELFKKSPFLVVFDKQYEQPTNLFFKINIIDQNTFHISAKGENIPIYSFTEEKVVYTENVISLNKTCTFGEDIASDSYKFKLVLLTGQEIEAIKPFDFFFNFNNLYDLSMDLRSKMKVQTAARNSTVANIDFELNNIDKAITFLQAWCDEYISYTMDKKTQVAKSTLKYIDIQLAQVSDSLNLSSLALQEYRIKHNIIDLTTQVSAAYSQFQELEIRESGLDIQNQYYKYINDYFEQNKDISDLVSPSSMGITDQSLNTMVQEYIVLFNQRKTLLDKSQQNNPQLKDLNIRIENLRVTIRENINYNLHTSEISLNEVRTRLNNLRNQVNQLPETERNLVDFERKYNLNEATYNFLLQKRVDAQIAESADVPPSQIIEPARAVSKLHVWPSEKLNYIIAFILGLLLPFGVMIIKELFNDKIRNINDIKRITDVPLLGEIGSILNKKEYNVFAAPNNKIAEMFRMLRTKLIYFAKSKDPKLVVVSSPMSNDGKSFVALNLALSYAAHKKKTVLINYDMRKPELDKIFNYSKECGLSRYLSGSCSLQDALIETEFDNLTFLPVGPIPPDPLEFISSDKTSELCNSLRKNFDYVIIDTSPSGIFSDAIVLSKYSDINILVVRCNHTIKKQLDRTIKEVQQNSTSPVEIVLNDCQEEKSDYYKYYNYQPVAKTSKKN